MSQPSHHMKLHIDSMVEGSFQELLDQFAATRTWLSSVTLISRQNPHAKFPVPEWLAIDLVALLTQKDKDAIQ